MLAIPQQCLLIGPEHLHNVGVEHASVAIGEFVLPAVRAAPVEGTPEPQLESGESEVWRRTCRARASVAARVLLSLACAGSVGHARAGVLAGVKRPRSVRPPIVSSY